MIVQATNTGGDLGGNQFDLMIPGGGEGIFDGCTPQYGSWNGVSIFDCPVIVVSDVLNIDYRALNMAVSLP